MTMMELLPTLNELNRAEKLQVMHYLVTELEKDESILLAGDYSIWSPYDSYEAASVLLEARAADQTGEG